MALAGLSLNSVLEEFIVEWEDSLESLMYFFCPSKLYNLIESVL